MFFRRGTKEPVEEVPLPNRPNEMVIAEAHAVLGTPMKPPFPEGTEQLIVAMGCFWGPERIYWQLDGVYTTAAGYSGGTTKNATYDDTIEGETGHAESVLIVFEPDKVGLEELLAIFWEQHDPTTPRPSFGFGSNYRSALFTTSPEQHAAALASRDSYQARLTDTGYTKIRTEIAEAGPFYYAEDYHQQYLHKNPKAFCPHGFCQVSYK